MSITSPQIVELAHELAWLIEVSEQEGDSVDVNGRIDSLLDEIATEAPAKLDALRAVALRGDSEAALCRAEARRLDARARSIAKGTARVRLLATSILDGIESAGGPSKIKTQYATHYLATTTSVQGPAEATAWPEQWQRVEIKPDRKGALAHMRKGGEIDGLILVESRGYRSR